jgi:plasmid stability protein
VPRIRQSRCWCASPEAIRDPLLLARLKARATEHWLSLEEEARELLRSAIARQEAGPGETLIELARRLFGPEHGIDLDIPPRGAAPTRLPPDYSEPDAGR